MKSLIRNPREFGAGVIYAAIGIAAIVLGRNYGMGTATKMGPAYFPSLLGALLAAIGMIAIIRSLLVAGKPIEGFTFRGLAMVLAAIVLFGLLARGAGLVVAIFVLVMVSARASVRFRWSHSMALAGGLAAFCTLVFVKGLGIPLPLLGSWFGG